MQVEYHRWYSPILGHDLELKVYGWYGKPVIYFPAQEGRYYDYENFGMAETMRPFIEDGRIKVFAVDGIDWQTWANSGAHPADRARRHEDYDRYITQEVAPFIRQHCGDTDQKFLATGVSMGAYHAANFFFRHPDVFDALIAVSGLYGLNYFIGDYMDDQVYFNSPLAYLTNMGDSWYLDQYRQSQIVVVVGQGAWEDQMLADTRELERILNSKNIPAWVDYWGHEVNHDWPWWHKMMPYYLGHILDPK